MYVYRDVYDFYNNDLSPYLTGMETSWRPVGDSSLRGSRRRLGDVQDLLETK